MPLYIHVSNVYIKLTCSICYVLIQKIIHRYEMKAWTIEVRRDHYLSFTRYIEMITRIYLAGDQFLKFCFFFTFVFDASDIRHQWFLAGTQKTVQKISVRLYRQNAF